MTPFHQRHRMKRRHRKPLWTVRKRHLHRPLRRSSTKRHQIQQTMVLPSIFGRWKAGQWHHLAAVWDRDEGVRVYEDGKEIFSNWGEHRWQWNHLPRRLSLAGPLDEVYVYAEPLTAKQIAQLANGQKATGTAIPISSPAERRDRELARFGWNEPNVGKLPTVSPDSPIKLTFARINSCVDAKRPVAYPYEGLLNSTWPSFKYGASTRGQKLEIALDENQDYDHAHREQRKIS